MSKVKQKQIIRRAEIIEAAIVLMNSVPFDELSVNDICAAAEISIGTFYHYFGKKSDLLIGLFGLIDEYLMEEVFPKLDSEDELQNLLSYARGFAQHIHENGIERSMLMTGIEPSDLDLQGKKRSAKIMLEEIIERGQKNGQITQAHSVETLANLFLLAIRGVAADWSRRRGSYSIVERMDLFMGLFVQSLGNRQEA